MQGSLSWSERGQELTTERVKRSSQRKSDGMPCRAGEIK